MQEKKMLAVRLQPELVEAIKDYAATEQESVNLVVEKFIRLGLARGAKHTKEKPTPIDAATRKMQYKLYRQAQQKGEVYKWVDKKMLAVRLSSELVDTVRDFAVKEEKNIVVVLEEFFHFGLKQKQGKVTIPTRSVQIPFRQRPRSVND
jgi:hypothetical protein